MMDGLTVPHRSGSPVWGVRYSTMYRKIRSRIFIIRIRSELLRICITQTRSAPACLLHERWLLRIGMGPRREHLWDFYAPDLIATG